VSDNLTSLVKKIDEATVKNKDKKMESFAVFLNDDEKLKDQLKELADKENLTKTVLTIDSPAGPAAYKIAQDADITVIMYVKRNVKANHAFRKGELKSANIDQIVADVNKIIAPEEDKDKDKSKDKK
jgi:hypothetical protein